MSDSRHVEPQRTRHEVLACTASWLTMAGEHYMRLRACTAKWRRWALKSARAATRALQLLTAANGELARLRREDILALVAAGLSYRKIGEAIGIDGTRVKQIQSGRPTGNSSRSRAAKAQAQAGKAEARNASGVST